MSKKHGRRPKILHCYSERSQRRAPATLREMISLFDRKCEHHVVGLASGTSDRSHKDAPPIHQLRNFPELAGRPGPGRLVGLAGAMAGYDLILSHGWETMNAAMAHRVFAARYNLPPLIHHEWDIGEEEFNWRRNWYRRIALSSASAVVVETAAAAIRAQRDWQIQPARTAHIIRGVEIQGYLSRPRADALPGLVKRKGEHWIGVCVEGALAAAGRELVEYLVDLPGEWHLLVMGEAGPTGDLRAAANDRGVSHRVHFASSAVDRRTAFALLDIFVDLGSGLSLAQGAKEAMAAGKPVIAAYDSEAASLLDEGNRQYLRPVSGKSGPMEALGQLCLNDAVRREFGKANAALAKRDLDRQQMLDSYRQLYSPMLRDFN